MKKTKKNKLGTFEILAAVLVFILFAYTVMTIVSPKQEVKIVKNETIIATPVPTATPTPLPLREVNGSVAGNFSSGTHNNTDAKNKMLTLNFTFSEDFENKTGLLSTIESDGYNYTIVDSKNAVSGPSYWHVTGEYLEQLSSIWGGVDDWNVTYGGTKAVVGNPGWTDYEFSLSFRPNGKNGVCFIFRYVDDDNYYRALMLYTTPEGVPFIRLERKVNGITTVLKTKYWEYKPLDWYNLSITTRNNASVGTGALGSGNIIIHNDTETLIDVEDPEGIAVLNQGKIGFCTYSQVGAKFDNVVVTGHNKIGEFTSAPFGDDIANKTWTNVSMKKSTPDGANVTLYLRGRNQTEWTNWLPVTTEIPATLIKANELQYKLVLKAEDSYAPLVKEIKINYIRLEQP